MGQSGEFCKETSPHIDNAIYNVTYLELNTLMPPCGSLDIQQIPKSHNALINQIYVNEHGYDINIKFEVSLHF